MPKKTAEESPGPDGQKLVRQQLDRILASSTFQQVDRLRRFLSFVVLESLAGRRDELKEYVVGIQVFGKESTFDPRTDPVVRVQARRLRARLVRYYREEGESDQMLIELPKGGYAPVFSRHESAGAPRRSITAALVSRNTVCVLPFADYSPSGQLGYLCQGLREEIINHLAGVRNVRVLAWDPSDAAKHRFDGLANTGDASIIITGSVRSAGDSLRVTTQFVDGASGCYLWSSSTDSPLSATFETQERVAKAVVAKLTPELVQSFSSGKPRRTGPVNLAAHNLYLQGRYHLNQRTDEGLRKALEFFDKALGEDAQYGLAHSGLSDAYSLLAHYGGLRPADTWTKSAASAASAVMLDGSSAEAHTSLAHAKSTQDWDWAGAEREFQRAIALDQRYATAHHWYATSALVPMGRLDEALKRMQIAQSLDPVSAIISRDVGVMQLYRRDYESALEHCDNTIELNPHFAPAYLTLALVQQQRKEHDESLAALERAAHLSPNGPRAQAALARALAIFGKRAQAFKILHALEAVRKERYVSPFDFAIVHLALGQLDQGFEYLSAACDDRCFELLAIKVDPRFDPYREDARFIALVRRLQLT
jgi:TolB-like protein/Flp pilus assembly protein TadD